MAALRFVFVFLLFPLLLMGQRITVDRVNVRENITLKGSQVDSISKDKLFGSPTHSEVPTQKAVFDFVSAQIAAINLSNYARSSSTNGLFVPGNVPISAGDGKLGENNNLNFASSVLNSPAYSVNGTGGGGFVGFVAQSSAPSTPAGGFRVFANGANNLAIRRSDGYITTIDLSTAAADRFFTLPANAGTFGILENAQTWTGVNTFSPTGSGGAGFIYSSTTRPAHPIGNVTTAQRDALTGQALFDVVGNSTTGRFNYWNGSAWVSLPSTASGGLSNGQIARGDANGNIFGDSDFSLASNVLTVNGSIYPSTDNARTLGKIAAICALVIVGIRSPLAVDAMSRIALASADVAPILKG